jgi:hypothetical protein
MFMTIEAFKKTHPSCWADLQYVGLQAAGSPALNKKMMYGGKVTMPLSDIPHTGQKELLINCGGASNKILSPEVKELFKKNVLPVMAEHFPELSLKYTGRIMLHFREGRLTTFTLTH